MDDLAQLRMIAERIPVSRSCYIHPDIFRRMVAHRDSILSCCDMELVKNYIDRSTDEESFAVLAEIAARAQLSADYKSIFCYLACKVYPAAGLKIPVMTRLPTDAKGELSRKHKVLLENLQRDIRNVQRNTVLRASL